MFFEASCVVGRLVERLVWSWVWLCSGVSDGLVVDLVAKVFCGVGGVTSCCLGLVMWFRGCGVGVVVLGFWVWVRVVLNSFVFDSRDGGLLFAGACFDLCAVAGVICCLGGVG